MQAKQTGARGEEYTAELLRRSGYRILARNYRVFEGEIDIVAAKAEEICFVEVKTRRAMAMVAGQWAVGVAKQRKIIRAALRYLEQDDPGLQPRFDVCVVHTDPSGRPTGHDYYKAAFDGSAYEG